MYVYVYIFFITPFPTVDIPLGTPENRSKTGVFRETSRGLRQSKRGSKMTPARGRGVPPPIFDFSYFSIFFGVHIFFVDVKFLKTRFSIFENRIFRFSLFHFFEDHPFSSFVLASVATRTSQGTCSAASCRHGVAALRARTRFTCACRFAHLACSPGIFYYQHFSDPSEKVVRCKIPLRKNCHFFYKKMTLFSSGEKLQTGMT